MGPSQLRGSNERRWRWTRQDVCRVQFVLGAAAIAHTAPHLRTPCHCRRRAGRSVVEVSMDSVPARPSDSAAAESPIDRALTLHLAGQHEAALRWAAALVRSRPAAPIGLLITARLMAAAGRTAVAASALETAVESALDAGNLPLAVAGCHCLRELGADASVHLDQIADVFASGSEQVLEKGTLPPQLPGGADRLEPLASALAGEALEEEASELLKEAREQLAADQRQRAGRPPVAPQGLFSLLPRDGLRAMVEIFDAVFVPTGHLLVEEGTPGAEAYVLARGELEVRRRGSSSDASDIVLARLGAGALFGEMALLSRAPRAASVVACRPSIVLVARKEALDAVVAEQPELGAEVAAHCRLRMIENLVRTSAILSAIKPSERPALIERFVTKGFEEGEALIVQGQESEGLYLIASGGVEVVHREGDESIVIASLGVGEVVGEVALVLRRPANANVIAAMPTVTLHLRRERFQQLITAYPAVLAQLYQLAVQREEETLSIVAQEAVDADELIII